MHLTDPDRAGHRSGWMGTAYGRAVTAADAAVARLLAAADRAYGSGNYSVIVTADHGGHERDHGSDDPRDVLIPWIAWGRGVARGPLVGPPVRTMDTAASVLWLPGLPEPAGWMGDRARSVRTLIAPFYLSTCFSTLPLHPSPRATSTYRSSPSRETRSSQGLQHTSQSWTNVPLISGSR